VRSKAAPKTLALPCSLSLREQFGFLKLNSFIPL